MNDRRKCQDFGILPQEPKGIDSQTAIFLFGVGCLIALYAIAAYDYFYGG